MPRKLKPGINPKSFRAKYTVDPVSKCWNWNLDLFRIKTDGLNLNPRRFAVYFEGRNIPVGRHVIAGCGNEKCINPEHTRLRHNGAGLNPNFPLYLDFDDFPLGRSLLRHKYYRSMDQIREAWKDTVRLIFDIRHTNAPSEELSERYGIGPSFIDRARKLKPKEFEALKTDPLDDGNTPRDETDEPWDAHLFTLDGLE